ncbi:leucyl aminopeptidase family protein [Actinokineospora bangkokensis]|uniref:Probable cytosol aminopeptidase n=1 Tax=Actinokineospora bangkokensis TaxID=1193682 RepID=A0A1Q9LDN0_9PSEU|nr:leucyl aminopeptidase [Actinokineospora bangkokensis]OLR90109.1 peptidase M17 [Actinokineospora bangkokensis]
MSTPVPTLPTTLPAVEVAASARAGHARVVLSRAAPEGPPLLGPGGDDLTADWVGDVALTGSAGEVRAAPAASAADWVLGVGGGTPADYRAAGVALVRAVEADRDGDGPGRGLALALPPDAGPDEAAQLARGLALGGYRFTVTAEERPARLRTARLVVPDAEQRALVAAAVHRSVVLASATAFARDLANTPSNVKDPAWLARTAARAAGRVPGLTATVHDERWLTANGFGGVLAVGGGSTRPPRLLHLTWSPPGATGPHLGLIGKGITFDTGGISIKPADGMHLMRTDMSGGAAVIAATLAVARLELPVRVSALVPCAENHVSGSAYRPGDVVRHHGGKTSEISNTDAEGRIVLADALVHAVDTLGVDVLVDVATLTGAMKVALGLRTGGLFASEDALAERVRAAGERAGEAWWRMPLLDEFADAVVSDLADVRQGPPGPGGITAALFLREFTAGLPWAHLDIAGPARADKHYDDVSPGGTGFAARTLVEFVASYAAE